MQIVATVVMRNTERTRTCFGFAFFITEQRFLFVGHDLFTSCGFPPIIRDWGWLVRD
jgi:hypothetical protein